MKIIDKATLLRQSVGTIFAEFEKGKPGPLLVFGGPNGTDDFFGSDLGIEYPQTQEDDFDLHAFWQGQMAAGGHAIPDFNYLWEDGWSGKNRQFVLLDREDATLLLQRVAKSLSQAYGVVSPASLL